MTFTDAWGGMVLLVGHIDQSEWELYVHTYSSSSSEGVSELYAQKRVLCNYISLFFP